MELALRRAQEPVDPRRARHCRKAGTATRVSSCSVLAGGVPAEWVEATFATVGQRTIVCFMASGSGAGVLESKRPFAASLALRTGARVLAVACRQAPEDDQRAAVARGIAAYTWLLGEGCDLDTTTFAEDSIDDRLVRAILTAASVRGLPLPADRRVDFGFPRIRRAPAAAASTSSGGRTSW